MKCLSVRNNIFIATEKCVKSDFTRLSASKNRIIGQKAIIYKTESARNLVRQRAFRTVFFDFVHLSGRLGALFGNNLYIRGRNIWN